MIRFSVCGAASYALGELLRLMVNHPETQVAHLADSFAAGRKIQDEHPALVGFYDQEILPLDDATLDMIVRDSDVVFTAVDAGTVPGIAAKVLAGSETKVCTVISFPLGFDAPEVKIFETEDALAKGAQEIDLVMNVSALKAGLYGTVDAELEGVVKASHDKGAIVKLIIETPLLTEEQIVKACELAEKNNVDIVKTSTGFSAMLSRSTSVDDVKLIRRSVRPETGVKAAGGIRTTEDTLAMIEAGATRIGASAGEAILNGLIE